MVRVLVAAVLLTSILPTRVSAQDAVPDSVRAIEEVLASFTKAALAEPGSPGTWTGLSAALEGLRPGGSEAGSTAAEQLARAYADSALAAVEQTVYRLELHEWNGGTELRIETTGGVTYSTGRVEDDPDRRFYVDLPEARSTLPAEAFPALDRGGVSAIDVMDAPTGGLRVVVSLTESLVYRIDREDDAVLVRFWSTDSAFPAWSSDVAWVERLEAQAAREAEARSIADEPDQPADSVAADSLAGASATSGLPTPGAALLEGVRDGALQGWEQVRAWTLRAMESARSIPVPGEALVFMLSALLGLAAAWLVVRRRRPRPEPAAPTPQELAPYAHRLLSSGAMLPDVARQTGFSRDGLAFVEFMAARRADAWQHEGGSSAYGNNVRAQ